MSLYMPLFQTLLGGLLAFLGGFVGNFLLQRSQRQKERESLSSAFCGEIAALLAIIERRQYLKFIKSELESVKQTGKVDSLQISVSRNYFQVYEHNIERIGLLPAPLPEKIVRFYTFMWACLEDLETMRTFEFKAEDALIVERLLEELLRLANDAIDVGNEAMSLMRPKDLTTT
jgi:hypothetical protein